jgi:hypothetical protein
MRIRIFLWAYCTPNNSPTLRCLFRAPFQRTLRTLHGCPQSDASIRGIIVSAGLVFLFLLCTDAAYPADPVPVTQGNANYAPTTPSNLPPSLSGQKGPTNVGQIPTPDTAPPPSDGSIPAPSSVTPTAPSPGQYRNARGEVNIGKMFLDRYKQSVVRVTSLDLAGNELSRAMGVGVGRNSPYIATALSIVLGNSQQWADKIEITHIAGNKYFAKVAYIDEEKNLVLLAPEASPTPLPMVRENDERTQIDVFSFSFANGPNSTIVPKIHRGILAAANKETGVLSVASTPPTQEDQAGSGIINAQGELVGMMLPEGRGILTSTLQKLVLKAQKAVPFEPNQVGAILGRGVLVDPKNKDAYPTITAALEAIKTGKAPKTDPTRYTPAKNRSVAPQENDKVVIKVMPGIYKEEKTLILGSDLSLSGSGPSRTQLLGKDPGKPVLLLQKSTNVIVSGFRIVPAQGQSLKAPGVIVTKGRTIVFLGNLFESGGGIAAWAHQSSNVAFNGNTFSGSDARALSCDGSEVKVNANAFIGEWPSAISAEKNCDLSVTRSFFLENKTAVSVSSAAKRLRVERSSFLKTESAIRALSDVKSIRLNDNLFFDSPNGFVAGGIVASQTIGRNSIWRSKFTARGRNIPNLDLVRTEPKFEDPSNYDYRLKPGQGQIGNAVSEEGADLGAFQREEYLGPFTQQLVRSLAVAVDNEDLPSSWGIKQ